jgi:hypothetical protein
VPLGVLAVAAASSHAVFSHAASLSAASSSAASDVEPGVLGFLIVAGMGVALVFLLRSMNKQFRKITPEPGPDPDGGKSDGASGLADGASEGASGLAGGVSEGRQAADPAEAPK